MSLTLTPDTLTPDTLTPDTLTPDTLTPDTSTAPDAGFGQVHLAVGLALPGPSPVDIDADDESALSSYARCADGNGTLSFLFFSEDDLELARAKAICRTCGLQDDCLSGAVEREEPYGVWGGKLVLEGVPVEFKRKRGRPPKNPQPILVVEEAPIPPHLVA